MKNNIAKKDILLILIFPTIITLLMFFPESIKENLKLNVQNPQFWQFFTSSYMHQSWMHLFSNLIGYFLFVIPIFLIVSNINKKKEYYGLFLFIAIVFPFISSFFQIYYYHNYLNKLMPNLKTMTGSSGIIAALGGFILVFCFLFFIERNNEIKYKRRYGLIGIFYLVIFFLLTYKAYFNLNLLFLFIGTFLILIVSCIKDFSKMGLEILKETRRSILIYFCLILSIIVFFFAPPILFPAFNNAAQNGSFTDFFTHFIGLGLGIAVSDFYFTSIYVLKKKK